MSTERLVWLVCDHDGCDATGPRMGFREGLAARLAAMEFGWVHRGLGVDYCPVHAPEHPSKVPA